MFVLGGDVRSPDPFGSHMIYAFYFGRVFLLGRCQFALRNMNFLTRESEKLLPKAPSYL